MKYNQQEVKEAIINIATLYNKAIGFECLMLACHDLPRIVELIVYHMFINSFDYDACNSEIKNAYDIIHEYAVELNENGFVKFKK